MLPCIHLRRSRSQFSVISSKSSCGFRLERSKVEAILSPRFSYPVLMFVGTLTPQMTKNIQYLKTRRQKKKSQPNFNMAFSAHCACAAARLVQEGNARNGLAGVSPGQRSDLKSDFRGDWFGFV